MKIDCPLYCASLNDFEWGGGLNCLDPRNNAKLLSLSLLSLSLPLPDLDDSGDGDALHRAGLSRSRSLGARTRKPHPVAQSLHGERAVPRTPPRTLLPQLPSR